MRSWYMLVGLIQSTTGFIARTRLTPPTRSMSARVGAAIPPDIAEKIASLYEQSDSVKVSY